MASLPECEDALQRLATQLAEKNAGASAAAGFDRTLSCSLTDLGAHFDGHLHDGRLDDIHQVKAPSGKVGLELTSDDLLALVGGSLNLASAWASGRVKVKAGVMDMLKLRSIF